MTASSSPTSEPGKDAGIEELQADIEQTREQLGRTVEALSEKFDVKARAKNKAQDIKVAVVDQVHTVRDRGMDVADKAKEAATDDEGNVKPAVPVSAAAAVALIALVVVLAWRRSR